MNLPSYSVAIRTLGLGGDVFRRELESLHRQTVMPEKIIVYIARGYTPPQWRVGMEEYVFVEKGMVAQRALRYREIESECVLMLDDDVELRPDSAELLLKAIVLENADAVAADTFRNQDMSALSKLKAAVINWALPRRDDGWAFKVRSSTSFSYNSAPRSAICLTQSAAGPAAMWRKSSFLSIRYHDELWLDGYPFAYGDDLLYFYKAYANGLKLMVHYECGIKHLDARTGSSAFRADSRKFFYRSYLMYVVWHRIFSAPARYSSFRRFRNSACFAAKWLWLLPFHMALSVATLRFAPTWLYIKGIVAARRYTRSAAYKSLPPYYYTVS